MVLTPFTKIPAVIFRRTTLFYDRCGASEPMNDCWWEMLQNHDCPVFAVSGSHHNFFQDAFFATPPHPHCRQSIRYRPFIPKFEKARNFSPQNPSSSPRAIPYLDDSIEIIHMGTCKSSLIEFRKGSFGSFMIWKKPTNSSAWDFSSCYC